MIYIYRTNQEWYQFLKVNGITQDVNFFRNGRRIPSLVPGDYFYFMDRNNQQIVGRGRYVGTESLSIEDAWNAYGIGNGAADINAFRNLILNVLNLGDNEDIQCIRLTDIQWLEGNQYLNNEYDMFPRENARSNFRRFNDDEAFRLNIHFDQLVQNNQINDLYYDENLSLPVRRDRVHFDRIRRDQNLVRQVKLIRENTCQICAIRLGTENSPYSEVHHIRPLGEPHNGEDILENMICVCPNCHTQLDYLYMPINIELIVEQNGRQPNHSINLEFIQWHNQRFIDFGRR
jgi:hypothetical protein